MISLAVAFLTAWFMHRYVHLPVLAIVVILAAAVILAVVIARVIVSRI